MNKSYSDYIISLFQFNQKDSIKNITFQVTDDCCCQCSYCYQINKSHHFMTKETGKQIIDLLFQMYYEDNPKACINQGTQGFIFEFIGGEPLLNIETIQYICDYYISQCFLTKNYNWLKFWRISMISNGTYYFDEKVQNFLKKYKRFLSFGITIDGPQKIHDLCRIYPDGSGNFNDAYKAFKHYKENYGLPNTKITLVPENSKNILEIIKFFVNEGITDIVLTNAYEPYWSEEQAKDFYLELKKVADYLLSLPFFVNIWCFKEDGYIPLKEDNLDTWCGGTGKMLAFDPSGVIYPCLRYTEVSLGDSQPPLIIGDLKEGIAENEQTKQNLDSLLAINRRTSSDDECFYCPIASSCSYCSAWHYQCFGTADKRSKSCCNLVQAISLANVYYWNKYYQKFKDTKRFKMYLPKEKALKIIPLEEYNCLYSLQKEKEDV